MKLKNIILISVLMIVMLVTAGCYGNKNENIDEKVNQNITDNKVEISNEYNVEFNTDEFLAVGYVEDEDLEKYKKQYFNTTDNLKEYDFTKYNNNVVNRFVFIPKSDDVLISVYRCNEMGKVELDKVLLDKHKGAFIVLADWIEYIPNLCYRVEYQGVEKEFYITFSGQDNSLIIADEKGNIEGVKDISIYK